MPRFPIGLRASFFQDVQPFSLGSRNDLHRLFMIAVEHDSNIANRAFSRVEKNQGGSLRQL